MARIKRIKIRSAGAKSDIRRRQRPDVMPVRKKEAVSASKRTIPQFKVSTGKSKRKGYAWKPAIKK